MKTLRLALCLVTLTVMTGCAACRPKSHGPPSSSSEQNESKHPFWDWCGEQAVRNLLNWAVCR
jgi:hypothetical protein